MTVRGGKFACVSLQTTWNVHRWNQLHNTAKKEKTTTLTPANDRSESPIENNDYRLTYLDELRGDRFGMCILGAFHLLQL